MRAGVVALLVTSVLVSGQARAEAPAQGHASGHAQGQAHSNGQSAARRAADTARKKRAREIRDAMKNETRRHLQRMKEIEKSERAARNGKDQTAASHAKSDAMAERMLHAQRMRDLRQKNEQNHSAVPKG